MIESKMQLASERSRAMVNACSATKVEKWVRVALLVHCECLRCLVTLLALRKNKVRISSGLIFLERTAAFTKTGQLSPRSATNLRGRGEAKRGKRGGQD
jgi:hypothetical protein